MTRFIHDQFAKDYLEELLTPFGTVEAPSNLAGEIREIDVLFSPTNPKTADIEILGLLGKLITTPAIFEPYRNPASKEEICDCLLKLLEVRGASQREAKRNKNPKALIEATKLWILTPTASQTLLLGFRATENSHWPAGIYFLADYLNTAIVVIHQLPRTPETLWLRLLGRETVQKQAIDELKTLPSNYPFQKVTIGLVYNLQKTLNINNSSDPEDKELIMRLTPYYQQDREQAIQEGLQQGLQEGEERLVMRLINRRFSEVEASLIERIKSLSVEQLENLGEALLDFSEVTDLENWLKEQK
ncbi:DUF4351 domain-containing protein [Dolichospermum sp. ST_con]|nr:DUF4351 domain-containing protein [Dolichospermum sp. ST_con]